MSNRFATATGSRSKTYDAGLAAYMSRVYNYMTGGLVVSALAAWACASAAVVPGAVRVGRHVELTEFGRVLFGGPAIFVLVILSFGLLYGIGKVVNDLKPTLAAGLFFVFSAVMGAMLTGLAIRYSGADLARAFFITASSFGALSIYGYTTGRNLEAVGSFCLMGLFGVIILGIVNLFMHSSMMQTILSLLSIVVFAGLTAWDTQKIKASYTGAASDQSFAIFAALDLYLDFLNLFVSILQLTGSSDD